jgi:predicted nucleic acid-binding Zn ribbon protein
MAKTAPPEVVAYFQQQAARQQRNVRPCAVCGQPFDRLQRARYCSAACSQKAYRERQKATRAGTLAAGPSSVGR